MFALPAVVLSIYAIIASTACTCDTNCSHVRNTAHGVWCLRDCGFAVLKDLYSTELLDQVKESFEKWSAIPKNVKRFGVRKGFHLRGMHSEMGLPDVYPFNRSEILYNHEVSQLVERHLGGQNASLESVTLLNNPSPSIYQPWHQDDGSTPFHVKVYVPLMDVSQELGPLEIQLLKYDVPATVDIIGGWTHSDDDSLDLQMQEFFEKYGEEAPYHFVKSMGLLQDCTVKGAFTRGTVMVYLNGIFHRGTPNLSGRNRTILHYSFVPGEDVSASRYMEAFRPHFQARMRNYRRLYQEHRNAAEKNPFTM